MMKIILQIILMPTPWKLRRAVLTHVLGYSIASTARIGWSVVTARTVVLEPGAHIGSLTYVKSLDNLFIGENGRLGNLNWVTGLPQNSNHFAQQPNRVSALRIGANASITHRHLLDCTDTIEIGAFSTVGGWGTQILTHSIDLTDSMQRCAPVTVGRYAFVGTRAILLKGACLPDYSVLSAGSVLAKAHIQDHALYSGVPAKIVKPLKHDLRYFKRSLGKVQ